LSSIKLSSRIDMLRYQVANRIRAKPKFHQWTGSQSSDCQIPLFVLLQKCPSFVHPFLRSVFRSFIFPFFHFSPSVISLIHPSIHHPSTIHPPSIHHPSIRSFAHQSVKSAAASCSAVNCLPE
jgi:hypothetical protein